MPHDVQMTHPSQNDSLTVDQQRTRLQLLLVAEQAKLGALVAQTAIAQNSRTENHQDSDTEPAQLCRDLLSNQQALIAELETQIEQLTDQLEGPALRSRLRQTEQTLKVTREELKQLKVQVLDLDATLAQTTTDLETLTQQNHHLTVLNDKYVKQIATLSIHERQNVEDHAHTVLAISRQLAAAGLDIPAEASAATTTPTSDKNTVHDWVTNAGLDQTLFSKSLCVGEQVYSVTLVVSIITPDTETYPIEVMLSEFNRRDRNHQIYQFKGFSTAEAVVSAQYFIHLHQKLAKQQATDDQDS